MSNTNEEKRRNVVVHTKGHEGASILTSEILRVLIKYDHDLRSERIKQGLARKKANMKGDKND